MRIRSKDYVVDWPHLVFVLLIGAAIGWYLFEARSVSLATNNLLLVQPLSLLGLGLCLFILPQTVRPAGQAVEEGPEEEDPLQPAQPKEARELLRIAVLGAALGAMIFAIPYVGFDVEAYPVDWRTRGWRDAFKPFPLLSMGLAQSDTAMHEWAGLIGYWWSGRIGELLPGPRPATRRDQS